MTGVGTSHGAVTVLNAALCGKGAVIGTNHRTVAEFSSDGGRRDITIRNDPSEDVRMARICVRRTLERIGEEEPEGWRLVTDSELPVSRGMKSSSSSCNAIILAVLDEYGSELGELETIRLGVECARSSGVTVTGAFDDACGCHFGGLIGTDNRDDTVLFEYDMDDVDIIFSVPPGKVRKDRVDVDVFRGLGELGGRLFAESSDDPFGTLTENGRTVGSVMGYDMSVITRAIGNGAVAAGITGFGPASVIIVNKGDASSFIKDCDIPHNIVTTNRGISK